MSDDGQASTVDAPFKDPVPTVERISKLAARVLSGDIILPKFQRDFVWPRQKVIGLLDSVALNYPIGSILLWQSRKKLANERTIAGLPIATHKPDYPVNYLLDGQQRLSTMCGALHWEPNGDPTSPWNIAYDLRERKFIHLYTLDDPPMSQVPVRLFSDPYKFFRRISALQDADLEAVAGELFNRLQDYMIAAVTLGDMKMDDIAPIFERINSTATPLTVVDLMRAATWDPNFDLREEIDSILARLAEKSYGGVGRKRVLRTIGAAAGFGFAVDDIDKLRGKQVPELEALLSEVKKASELAVDFLTTQIKSPGAAALPYANQFAVLTELFRRIPTPDGDQYSAIERWFWRTTLSGYFSGWNTGQMSRDYKGIEKFAKREIAEIEVTAALPQSDVWRLAQFRANSAVSKMSALIMSYNSPLDLLTGQKIDYSKSLAWSNDREFHHLFPKAFLKSQGVSEGRANSVANVIMLTSVSNIKISSSAPSKYLASLQEQIGREELLRRLGSVLVSEEALDAALSDDYAKFQSIRSDVLQERAIELVGETASDMSSSGGKLADEVLIDDLGGDQALDGAGEGDDV